MVQGNKVREGKGELRSDLRAYGRRCATVRVLSHWAAITVARVSWLLPC